MSYRLDRGTFLATVSPRPHRPTTIAESLESGKGFARYARRFAPLTRFGDPAPEVLWAMEANNGWAQ